MIRKSNIQLTCYLTLDLERLRHERVHCSAFEWWLKDALRSSSVAAGLCCADCSKMALDGQRCRLEYHAVVVVLNRMLINLYCLGLFDWIVDLDWVLGSIGCSLLHSSLFGAAGWSFGSCSAWRRHHSGSKQHSALRFLCCQNVLLYRLPVIYWLPHSDFFLGCRQSSSSWLAAIATTAPYWP